MNSKKNILFVSHDASRTGAPIILLNLLRWLKKNTDVGITILTLWDGPLKADFAEVGTTYIWGPKMPNPHLLMRGISKFSSKIIGKSFKASYPQPLKTAKFDLIYLNTVASLDVASILKKKYQCPVIAHIHENSYSIQAYYSDSLSSYNKGYIDKYLAVSKSTKQNLIDNHQVDEKDIELIYEFVDTNKVKQPTESVGNIKHQLGIENSFVVGGSGLMTWRKGIDYFIALAVYLVKNYPDEDIKFIWVGHLDSYFKIQLDYELERLEIEDRIIFTDTQANPFNYFQVYDTFVLTSREDPFPLVCLEAAALSKPIICFENSGGMTEFLAEGRGIIVPFGDIKALAEAVINLKQSKLVRDQFGERAKEHISYYDVEQVAPLILNVIENANGLRHTA